VLVPRSSRYPVPESCESFRVSTQDQDDHACGLHCIVMAAHHLRTIPGRAGARWLIESLAAPQASRVRGRLTKNGLKEQDIRALAAAAGLALYRPNKQKIAQFHEPDWLWMACVRVQFTPGNGSEPSYDANHYVLVLEHLADLSMFVLADPHPWNGGKYHVRVDEFEAAWRTARPTPWAAHVYRARF
jgi:hypothetical protein